MPPLSRPRPISFVLVSPRLRLAGQTRSHGAPRTKTPPLNRPGPPLTKGRRRHASCLGLFPLFRHRHAYAWQANPGVMAPSGQAYKKRTRTLPRNISLICTCLADPKPQSHIHQTFNRSLRPPAALRYTLIVQPNDWTTNAYVHQRENIIHHFASDSRRNFIDACCQCRYHVLFLFCVRTRATIFAVRAIRGKRLRCHALLGGTSSHKNCWLAATATAHMNMHRS